MHGLDRINEILKLLIHQLDVLETMTPLDFLDFRDLLYAGLRFPVGAVPRRSRPGSASSARAGSCFDALAFDDRLSTADRARLAAIERKPKLSSSSTLAAPHAVRASAGYAVLGQLSDGGREDAEGRRGARARRARC